MSYNKDLIIGPDQVDIMLIYCGFMMWILHILCVIVKIN